MSRWEWLVIVAMLVIAGAAAIGHLDGTALGRWLAGEALPDMRVDVDDRVFYAIPLLALLIWWGSQLIPDARQFLRTGAVVLLAVGVLYALWRMVS